jgi:hypothetical protein
MYSMGSGNTNGRRDARSTRNPTAMLRLARSVCRNTKYNTITIDDNVSAKNMCRNEIDWATK